MVEIEKYNTITSVVYENVSDVDKLFFSVRDAIPFLNPFFIMLFGVFLALSFASYYVQLRLVGNQRFFNSLIAGSFGTFLISILFSLMELISPLHVMIFIVISVIAYTLATLYR